jgi:hypothetical protein
LLTKVTDFGFVLFHNGASKAVGIVTVWWVDRARFLAVQALLGSYSTAAEELSGKDGKDRSPPVVSWSIMVELYL